ncbi:MAG: homoserine kinase [Halanaerobiales bacterium]
MRKNKLKLKVPATSANLGPGFDCMGLGLKYYNTFIFEKIKDGIEIVVEDKKEGRLAINREDNLIYRAVKEFSNRTGVKVAGWKILQQNRIPLARGMGSSATAIIAALFGLNRLYDKPLSQDEIIKIAVEIEGHADNVIPAFLGGFTINVQTEDEIYYKKILVNDHSLKLILVIPDFQLKTSRLRQVLPEKVKYADAVFNQGRTALLTAIFSSESWQLLKTAMEDKLHQDYRSELIPGFKEVIKSANEAGALGSALSGAGPTIMALSRKNYEQIGEAMSGAFREKGVNASILIRGVDNQGVRVIKE